MLQRAVPNGDGTFHSADPADPTTTPQDVALNYRDQQYKLFIRASTTNGSLDYTTYVSIYNSSKRLLNIAPKKFNKNNFDLNKIDAS
ncbi:hypothetical protein FACS1894166_07960 [Bacilli bacterium]|nr:hypothetical protein FACS1894166_07960 [Bacilli bacterium]